MKLSRLVVCGVLAAVLAGASESRIALADDAFPVIGTEFSVAVPLEGTRATAEVGGSAGVFGGYHFQLNEMVGLSLLANPEFTFFPSDHPRNPNSLNKSDVDVISIMALNAGPRLTIGGDEARLFIDGRGGYYRELSGPLNSDGPGYNVGAGVAFAIAENTALTVGGRYNESFMRAKRGSHQNFRFVTAGLGLEHYFRAPEAVAPAPAPPPPPPPAAAPMKRKMILRGVNFDFDKANIRADARPVLDEAISTLKDGRDVRVSVEGHTDSRGTEAYNQALSLRRARAVEEYLESGGISASRLEISGFGETRPVASNDTDDGRAQNRRVELNVVP